MKDNRSCIHCAKLGFPACPHPDSDVPVCDDFEDRSHWLSQQLSLVERSMRRLYLFMSVGAVLALLLLAIDVGFHVHQHGAIIEHIDRHASRG